MRILIFNTFYYPKFVGGAEISVQLLAEGLVKAHNDVFVVTFGPEEKVDRINGVVVIRIKQNNIYSSYNDDAHSPISKAVWHLTDSFNPFYHNRIANIIKRAKPDVVHTNNIQGFSPMLWATIKKLELPLVHTIRDYYFLCYQCNMFRNNQVCIKQCIGCRITGNIKEKFITLPDVFVGISNYIIKSHLSILPESKKTKVIYNGINQCKGTAQKQLNDRLTFGFMGRVAADKGIEFLVNELNLAAGKSKAPIKLVVAGKGDHRYIHYLETLATNYEIEFVGVITPARFYTIVDVLIVPSLWAEPFGRTVIEALSHKTPVCIAKNGGLTELHDESCTWIFETQPGELSSLIQSIAADKLCVAIKSDRCLDYASNFSTDNYVKNHIELYNSVLPVNEAAYQTDFIEITTSP